MNSTALVQWFDRHYYKLSANGVTQYIPSVTTKLGIIDKPHLDRWRSDLGTRESDLRLYDAQQRGTRIHWAYATALEGGAVVYDPWQKPVYTKEGLAVLETEHKNLAILRTQEEMWTICKLQEQFKRLNPRVMGVEKTVFDLATNDAGTIDSIFWIEEGDYLIAGAKPLHLGSGVYICDLKTGNYVDDGVWYQLAPYAVMWEKMFGLQVAGALVTHTGATVKSGISGLKTMFRSRDMLVNADYPVYRHAAALWEAKHKDDQPHTYEFPSIVTLNVKKEAVCDLAPLPSSPLAVLS